MSLVRPRTEPERSGFPRVSGDEPVFLGGPRFGNVFSPRERG